MTFHEKMVEDKQAGTIHVAKRELEVLQLHLKFDVHSTAELLVKAIEQKII